MMRSFSIVLSLLLTASLAHAQTPERMQYQGFLTDLDGTPVQCPSADDCPAGPFDMTLRLYDVATEGVAIWEEEHPDVSISDGVFTLTLGANEPLDVANLPENLWLGLSINDTPEALPRQEVVSAAFALRASEAGIAQDADALGGMPADSYATKDELPGLCVTQEALTETLANEPPDYTNADVEVVLVDGAYVQLADLAAVAITGSYLDLSDTPPVLSQLAVNEAGDLTFAGTPILNSTGEWIGAATGLQGPQGEPGQDGQAGSPGQEGAAGANAMVLTSEEPQGDNCAAGGVKITSGTDTDGSGTLDVTEVQSISYVCNGAGTTNTAVGGTSAAMSSASEPPGACTLLSQGQFYFDTTLGAMRYCDGTYWTSNPSTCGNGIVDQGEECDDGNLLNYDGCQKNCLIASPDLCTNDCLGEKNFFETAIFIPGQNMQAGQEVAIQGDMLFVGGEYDSSVVEKGGAVAVYKKDEAGTWTNTQFLQPIEPAGNDNFGSCIAVHEDKLAIGARGMGAVFLYSLTGTGEWSFQQKINAPVGYEPQWGSECAIYENQLAVGTWSGSPGIVHLFTQLETNIWELSQPVEPNTPENNDVFGFSLVLEQDILFVSSHYATVAGYESAGAVYVFTKEANGLWEQESKITLEDEAESLGFGLKQHYFGKTLAWDGTQLFAGAPGGCIFDNCGPDGVFVFSKQGDEWVLDQDLLAINMEYQARLGSSLAISGNRLISGAPQASTGGALSLYQKNAAGIWNLEEFMVGSDVLPKPQSAWYSSETFGASVAMSGPYILAGSPYANLKSGLLSPAYEGAAYIFEESSLCTKQGVCICESGYGGADCTAPVNYVAPTQPSGGAGSNVVYGDYTINNSVDLNNLKGYTEITGNLTIQASSLPSLVGLESLAIIGGQLTIANCTSLQNLEGLSGLTSIGNFRIQYNTALTSFSGLTPGLQVVDALEITKNNKIQTLDGLSAITSLGKLSITYEDELTSLDGFPNIDELESLYITYCPITTLIDLPAFEILNRFSIYFSDIISLNGLILPSEVDHIAIENNDLLENIEALSGLIKVTEKLRLQNNDNLTSSEAFSTLIEVHSLTITSNDNLADLSGFSNLLNLSELELAAQPITSLTPFSNITSLNGHLKLSSTEGLNSFEGLENIASIGYVSISGNFCLAQNDIDNFLSNIIINGPIYTQNNGILSPCP